MTKINTILQGFVDINLELDEKKATRLGEAAEDKFIQDNLVTSKSATANNLHLPISLDKLAQEVGISKSSMQFVSLQGSRVYGVNIQDSDWDITIVSNEISGYRFIEFYIDGFNYDINAYSPEEFKARLERHEMKELEILSYPKEFVLIESVKFNTEINRTQLINMVIKESDELWYRAKSKLDSKTDVYQALKTIWHSIRFLIFAEQILRYGSIEKIKAANVLRDPIVNSKQKSFDYFNNLFGELREKMKNELNSRIDGVEPRISESTDVDEEIKIQYAIANFQGFYIQKGDATPNVELRYINNNSDVYYEDETWRMFIKFGDYINQNWRTFNPPNKSQDAPTFGNNCISGYDASVRSDNFQQNSKIFFGKNPSTDEYGDLRIRIKNLGTYTSKINGYNLAVGESLTIDINKFNWNIKLPANSTLVRAGNYVDGVLYDSNSLTECVYEFVFEVDYEELGFKLRDENNYPSKNKEINIGSHRFNKTYSDKEADDPANYYNLTTEYANVWPFWENNFKWPETGPYCIKPGTPAIPDPIYPTDLEDLQNVMIDGIAFLHQTDINANIRGESKTQYIGFKFNSNGEKASDKGCSSVKIQYTEVAYAPQLQTSSIPFRVI